MAEVKAPKAKKLKVPTKVGKIIVPVKSVSKETLYMTTEFGSGTYGKTKFHAVFTLPAMGLMVTIDDKKYLVSSQDLIQEVIKIHEGR